MEAYSHWFLLEMRHVSPLTQILYRPHLESLQSDPWSQTSQSRWWRRHTRQDSVLLCPYSSTHPCSYQPGSLWSDPLELSTHIEKKWISDIWSHHPKCQSHWNTCKMPQFNSTGRFYFFLPFPPPPSSSAAYHNESWTVHFQKQLR